jgi:hypothetical protein
MGNTVAAVSDNVLLGAGSDAGNVNNTFDNNLYASAAKGGGKFSVNSSSFGSLAAYQHGTGQDRHSHFGAAAAPSAAVTKLAGP